MSVPMPEPADIARLEQLLTRLGATDEEIEAARGAHAHGALALDLALRGPARTVGLAEAAERLGTEPAAVARFWEALGFADPAERRLPESLIACQQVLDNASTQWLGEDAALGIARVIGGATARLAEAVVDAFRMGFEVPELMAGVRYSDVVEAYLAITREMLPSFEQLVTGVFEAHLVRVAGSAWMPSEDSATTRRDLAVGFVDLVGYTALSRTLGPRELAGLLQAFEATAGEALARAGARPVKAIGDGVMFTAPSAAAGCAAAVALAEAFDRANGLPPVRVGLAYGPVLSLYGDYFGDVVNLAARLVALANPGTVVVSDEVAGIDGWVFERLPAQALKGFGAPPAVFRLVGRHPGQPGRD